MGDLIWSIVAIIGAFIVVGGVFYFWFSEQDDDRGREEQARVYFDEHGHWPDGA